MKDWVKSLEIGDKVIVSYRPDPVLSDIHLLDDWSSRHLIMIDYIVGFNKDSIVSYTGLIYNKQTMRSISYLYRYICELTPDFKEAFKNANIGN